MNIPEKEFTVTLNSTISI